MPVPDELSQAVGVVIAGHRTAMKLTQDEFAVKAGLHRTYISDVERGSRNISLKTLQRLAKALNVRTFDLLMEAEASRDEMRHESESDANADAGANHGNGHEHDHAHDSVSGLVAHSQ